MNRERTTFDRIEFTMVREKASEPYNRQVISPSESAKILGPLLRNADREKFIVLMLSSRNDIVAVDVSSVGTRNESLVDIPLVFRGAIMTNCTSIIVAHNHPCGNAEPSTQDIAMTRRLKEAGDIIGIRVYDHLIFGGEDWISLAERGLM